jgi:serine/threonine-protein kinase
MPDLIPLGTVLRARYKIDSILYQSKLSNVYYVSDLHMPGKVWVIKELQPIAADPVDRNRTLVQFHAEALNISSLSHPHFAQLMDFFVEGSNMYIVREYIHGTDLGSIMSKMSTPFDEKSVVTWGIQLADTLGYLYGKKLPAVFFREFHIGNIILSTQGGVKIIDLGLARMFQTGADAEVMKRMSSADYASPEQFDEIGAFDQRSLVYNLGAILYHLLTRKNPGTTPFKLAPAQTVNPSLSRGLVEIIRKATEIDPKDRYQSLIEMKRDLMSLSKYPEIFATRSPVASEKEDELQNWLLGVFLVIIIGSILLLVYFFFLKP